MRYIQLIFPILGRQTLWLLLAFFLTLGVGENIAMAAPVNDMFGMATSISDATGTISGSTIDATAEVGEPDHDNDPDVNPPHHSIWYEWIAPSSDPMYFYTQGSSFDTVLAIYTGSPVNSLTRIASNDDDDGFLTSKVSFIPTSGTIYYIAIDGFADDEVYEENIDFGSTVLRWVPVSYMVTRTLAVQKTGTGLGTVKGSGLFDDGTITWISATATDGSTFTGWSGDCSGTASPLSVVMDADKTCTATFNVNTDTHTLTLIVDKEGTGSGKVAGGGTYVNGTSHDIYAFAAADPLSVFIGWSGDCSGTASPLSVVMDDDKTCTATFNLFEPRTLTVDTDGTGTGTVTGGGIYGLGTTQEISATADTGSTFVFWTGEGCTGTTSTLSVLMDAADADTVKTCTATFTLNTHTLTVNKTGNGMVTSAPDGIACGVDCSEVYNFNDLITLTATPDADNIFVGWSGGNCAGRQDCTVTIDGDITISAIFKKYFPWPMFVPAITKGGTIINK